MLPVEHLHQADNGGMCKFSGRHEMLDDQLLDTGLSIHALPQGMFRW